MSRLKQLKLKLDNLVDSCIQIETIQNCLYNEYTRSPTVFQQRNSKTGKLHGIKFKNSNIKLTKCFNKFEELTVSGKYKRLKKVKIHPRIVLSSPVYELVKDFNLVKEINQDRENILMNSRDIIINMINSKSRYDVFIEREDISQSAWSVAWEATLQYDPKRGVWEKYLVYTLNRALYKYIAENSRLISLPRWILSRWSPISKAIKENKSDIVRAANNNANSTVAKKKKYTDTEINNLSEVINNSYTDVSTIDTMFGYEPPFTIDTKMLRSQLLDEGRKLLDHNEFKYLLYKLEGYKRVDILEKIKETNPSFTFNQLNKTYTELINKLKQSDRLKKIMEFIKEEE